jgi:hypothetical protein
MKNQTVFSKRPRPSLCSVTLDLHVLVLRLFGDVRAPAATRLKRATERIALAVEHAALGFQREFNLSRATKDMSTCLLSTKVLHAQGIIDARTREHLCRRIDQIVGGIEQQRDAAPEQRLTLELPPLGGDDEREQSAWQTSLARVADEVRSLMPEKHNEDEATPLEDRVGAQKASKATDS